jgi:hypothetical protein
MTKLEEAQQYTMTTQRDSWVFTRDGKEVWAMSEPQQGDTSIQRVHMAHDVCLVESIPDVTGDRRVEDMTEQITGAPAPKITLPSEQLDEQVDVTPLRKFRKAKHRAKTPFVTPFEADDDELTTAFGPQNAAGCWQFVSDQGTFYLLREGQVYSSCSTPTDFTDWLVERLAEQTPAGKIVSSTQERQRATTASKSLDTVRRAYELLDIRAALDAVIGESIGPLTLESLMERLKTHLESETQPPTSEEFLESRTIVPDGEDQFMLFSYLDGEYLIGMEGNVFYSSDCSVEDRNLNVVEEALYREHYGN